MKPIRTQLFGKISQLTELLKPPPGDLAERAYRLQTMERNVIMPVKLVFIGILVYYFYFSLWFGEAAISKHVALSVVELFFSVYLLLNLAVGTTLLVRRRLPMQLVQWIIFTVSFVDGLFLASLTLVTGGFDSILYWLFLGLIVRNAVSNPLAVPQIILNLSVSFCFVLAGVANVVITNEDLAAMDESARRAVELAAQENPAEPFFLRLIVLLFLTACCYGVQVLFEKQRLAEEEAREFTGRQEQLRAAGRLAAEIAHQIKNPLAIINNAVFTLQRAVDAGRPAPPQQVAIIREEVERSDRILTELMGYAQLAEGRVEKLNIIEELNRAINKVFPPGVYSGFQVLSDYGEHLPALLMQRKHLSEILVNLLQNSREAMPSGGELEVRAEAGPDHSIDVTIKDDGPGIPAEKLERIFHPYFTTKAKGTGLGLSIVRHNAEMYGATVRAESELGNGAEFILHFPTRTYMKSPP